MTPTTYHLIAHTHWDREWYHPRAVFQLRLAETVRDLIAQCRIDPSYQFLLDGQTVILHDTLQLQPEWRDEIDELIRRDQLAIGPWFVLGDELIPTGESLIRNLLQGKRDGAAHGGWMRALYSPDCFGHPAILPTLAQQFGIDAAVAWRGVPSVPGQPDQLEWRGPDGSAVTLLHLPPQGYEMGVDLACEQALLAARWRSLREQLLQRATTTDVAILVGADHHAPVDAFSELAERIRQLDNDDVVVSSLEQYFDAVAANAPAFALITGELRHATRHTWALGGIGGTRARLKRRHSAVELHLLRHAEPLAALLLVHRGVDLRAPLQSAWRILLECQFHDTLCGCCSDDVAREQDVRLTTVARMTTELVRRSLHLLANHDPDAARNVSIDRTPTLLLWNPATTPRHGIVVAELSFFVRDTLVGPPGNRIPREGSTATSFCLVAVDGTEHAVQVLARTRTGERRDARRHYPDQDEVDRILVAFIGTTIPGCGFTTYQPRLSNIVPPAAGIEVSPDRLANRMTEIHIDPAGRVDLFDRRTGEHYRDVLQLVDAIDHGDSYTSATCDEELTSLAGIRTAVIHDGPLVGTVRLTAAIFVDARGQIAELNATLTLFADSPFVRVRLHIYNRAANHRLRLCVPTGVDTDASTGAAFGVEHRSASDRFRQGSPIESWSAAGPSQRYIATARGDRGMAFLAPGFFEAEAGPGHEMLVTLVRSTGELSRSDLAERPGHAGWPMSIPDAQEAGRHVLECAIGAVTEREAESSATMETCWEQLFLPPVHAFERDFTGDADSLHGISLELRGEGLICSALKPAERGDAIAIRCWNTTASVAKGSMPGVSGFSSIRIARADESKGHALEVAADGSIAFDVPARALHTIILGKGSAQAD